MVDWPLTPVDYINEQSTTQLLGDVVGYVRTIDHLRNVGPKQVMLYKLTLSLLDKKVADVAAFGDMAQYAEDSDLSSGQKIRMTNLKCVIYKEERYRVGDCNYQLQLTALSTIEDLGQSDNVDIVNPQLYIDLTFSQLHTTPQSTQISVECYDDSLIAERNGQSFNMDNVFGTPKKRVSTKADDEPLPKIQNVEISASPSNSQLTEHQCSTVSLDDQPSTSAESLELALASQSIASTIPLEQQNSTPMETLKPPQPMKQLRSYKTTKKQQD
ncbi:unnamed protein product [Bursaphelenchus okinawaensis]|uniref:Uncharacterized protein n=1 Tax=Bursaphelenchus okinawaensis TaxID=465554 RepID=A0A811KG15_9BILA|nr:unnamed protein product [Bursaphelenchus okinawaensis]CAG9101553.1 unnamed protein product [Bursaphelenchus okinawaensis]